jgi:hypothetical protein
MPEDYIRLSNVIDAIDLLRRWTGISEDELAAMIKGRIIPAYRQVKRLKSADGEVISFCNAGAKPWVEQYNNSISYDWSTIVFSLEDVLQLENQHPEFMWIPENSDEPDDSSSNSDDAKDEWVRCDTLSSRWGVSPFDVLEILRSGELRYNMFFGGGICESIHELGDTYVHNVDLLRWETANQDRINNAPVLEKDGELLRQEIRSLTQKIAELEAGKAALQLELEARPIISPKPPEPPKPPRTAAASKAATEMRVEEWKRHASCMVKVAFECCAQGPRKRKRPEFRRLAKKHGGELPDVALDILRDALPEEHVSRDAGPSRQD